MCLQQIISVIYGFNLNPGGGFECEKVTPRKNLPRAAVSGPIGMGFTRWVAKKAIFRMGASPIRSVASSGPCEIFADGGANGTIARRANI
jgi:hypothetical protein